MLNVSEAVNKYLFESSAQHGRNLVWARDVLNFVEEVGLGDGRERDLDTGRAEQGKAFIPWSVGGAEAHRSSVDVGLRDEHDSTKCTGFCVCSSPPVFSEELEQCVIKCHILDVWALLLRHLFTPNHQPWMADRIDWKDASPFFLLVPFGFLRVEFTWERSSLIGDIELQVLNYFRSCLGF